MQNPELIPHLFRTEYRKIVSVLCRRFGFDEMETAEDITSDTFLTAAQSWSYKGIPPNPTAWLYNVAKNKAKNHLQRNATFQAKVSPEIQTADSYEQDIDLSPQNISDSQLQMMFAICHPAIPPEAQIGLALRILCGFGIDEIAEAFLTGKETINKRLFRAKEKIRNEKIKIELPAPAEIDNRLENVLTTIYLLFSEGYYSVSDNQILRKDLCFEAMRLCHMLIENGGTNKPPVNALLSLMYFHASRFEARTDPNGGLILYDDQDTTLWNQELIARGAWHLNQATTGTQLSKYHLEASIAYWHTQKTDSKEKWENILQLYNRLLQIAYSPVAALNRTFALAKANTPEEAIIEAEKLQLTGNQFYYTLLGELYTGINNEQAKLHFEKALTLIKTPADRAVIQSKIDTLENR
ncbi:RNA polymerase sigma-70 factor, ECF subfamily [Mucilaginibacter gossypiicola]|uniref:RNA polymerase sigma-70 factor, ECF subfamily n=1 Tax=Mucilaginibacter gossypiicola TaxID=551995 RepID=A0A1H8Q2K2_9SPHI|nr:sigma-70 family RNA polymerase sigma factor [Mucilaginibacter gossypiicola]SEO47993.1 RNA polymerase sigma-70 factor, ECF subfamily [Mucilaginibacter gossypiicola]